MALAVLSILLLVALTGAIRPSSAATAVTWNVSPSGSDTTGNGSSGNPFATITKAVSMASSGDTVLVGPGTYHEMVNITTKVFLMSIGGNPANTMIDANGLSMGVFVRGAAAAGSIVQGFTVKNANDHGIYAQDTSKVIIENNIVSNNGLNPNPAFSGEDKAVELVGTAYSVITGNQVVDNRYGGIAVNDNGPINPGYFSPGTLAPALGNVVSGNTVMGNKPNHCAIVVSAYDAGAGVINNVVSNNLVIDNQNGIVIAANTPNSQSVNNSVIYNTIINNGEAAVIIHANSPGAVNSGTMVVGNVMSGNGYGFDIKSGSRVEIAKYTGVLVGGESNRTSASNTLIVDNFFHNQYNGIYIVEGTETAAYSNVFDSTVNYPVNGSVSSESPVESQLGSISGAISSIQSALNALQQSSASKSDVSALTSSLNSLSTSAAKASDLSALSGSVTDLQSKVTSLQNSVLTQSDLSTTSYIAYAAVALAIVAMLVAVVMSRKKP